MKRLSISCFVLFSIIITASAQVKPFVFSAAVKADNVSQKDLYKQGKHWFNETFQCKNRILSLDDASQGVIVGKCTFIYTSKVAANSAKTNGEVRYQVKLRFSDGRYQYEISDFRHTGSGISFDLLSQDASTKREIAGASAEWKTQVWNDIKAQAKEHSTTIIKSLIAEMSKPSK